LNNLLSLRDINDQIEEAEEQLKDTKETLDQALQAGQPSEFTDIIKNSIEEIELYIEDLKDRRDNIRLSRELTLRNAIISIIELSGSIIIAEASLSLQKGNLERVNIRHGLGLASSIDIRTIERNISQLRLELNMLKSNQQIAQQNLNRLLGEPLTQNTTIELDKETISELIREFIDNLPRNPEELNTHINNLVKNNHTIKRLQEAADEAEEVRDDYKGSDKDITKALDDALERAILNLDQVKAELEAELRQQYNNLNTLIAQMQNQENELKHHKQALEAAQINFELGRISNSALEQFHFAVVRGEVGLELVTWEVWGLIYSLN